MVVKQYVFEPFGTPLKIYDYQEAELMLTLQKSKTLKSLKNITVNYLKFENVPLTNLKLCQNLEEFCGFLHRNDIPILAELPKLQKLRLDALNQVKIRILTNFERAKCDFWSKLDPKNFPFWFCEVDSLLVLERATRNSITQRVLTLKTQTRLNSSSKKPEKTCITQAKTQNTRAKVEHDICWNLTV